MWPYWLLYLIPSFMALNQKPMRFRASKKLPIVWWLIYFMLVLAVGLRYEVGADWFNYIRVFEGYNEDFSLLVFIKSDPGYKLLNLISLKLGGGIVLSNFLSALIFAWGLLAFCRAQPRSWLALSVAIPYLVTVVAMGYTRQGISIGLVMLAIVALTEKRMIHYFIFMTIAVTFHKSAIIMLPLVALTSTGNRWLKIILMVFIGLMLYWLMVRDATDKLVLNYVDAQYSSAGTGIRLAMNIIPAGLFLIFRKRFNLESAENSFWTMISISAFLFIPLFMLSPSSTAVDRVALYWIPIQLFIFSRLPDAMGKPGRANINWVFLVILYYAAVLAVWLLFANHSKYWLPYNFFPWEWFWDLPSTFENESR